MAGGGAGAGAGSPHVAQAFAGVVQQMLAPAIAAAKAENLFIIKFGIPW